jgi:hypothetical protein
MTGALTDYSIREIRLLGRGGSTKRAWTIETGPYHKAVATFMSRREAEEELAFLVNEAYEKNQSGVSA